LESLAAEEEGLQSEIGVPRVPTNSPTPTGATSYAGTRTSYAGNSPTSEPTRKA